MQLLEDTVVAAVDSEILGLSSASMRPMLMAAVGESEYALVLKTPRNPAGWFRCSRSWIRKLWRTMGMRIRPGATAAQKLPHDCEERLELWKLQIAHTMFNHDIPRAVVVNVDQTSINLVPVGRRTLTIDSNYPGVYLDWMRERLDRYSIHPLRTLAPLARGNTVVGVALRVILTSLYDQLAR
eukprot:320071-Chlamydomonas_euryale.AAC.1